MNDGEYSKEYFDEKLNEIFADLIQNKEKATNPKAFVLGGQPGSGKTGLQIIAAQKCNRRIHINEITNITIERYEIRRALGKYNHYQEQRLKMRITPTIGKNIILTDTATIVDRALIRRLSDINYLQNENVPLYQAYQVIRSMRGD